MVNPVTTHHSQQLLQQLVQKMASGCRAGLVLSGDRDWACQQSSVFFKPAQQSTRILLLGNRDIPELAAAERIEGKAARHYLGQEADFLIVDAWAGLDPDALTALSGTLVGGGLLIILAPPLAEWPAYRGDYDSGHVFYPFGVSDLPGYFLQRFIRLLAEDESIVIWQQEQSLSEPVESVVLPPRAAKRENEKQVYCGDQAQAIAAIKKAATGHRRRPLVISADRGRGKTAALGMAAAELLLEDNTVRQVVVTAPDFSAVEPLFLFAEEKLAAAGVAARFRQQRLYYSDGGDDAGDKSEDKNQIRFYAADDLLRDEPRADLLLIDEAAAIPSPLLEKLLVRYARVVFATTIHGYEGSGRGFALRFFNVLDRLTPQWKRLEMSKPIRWLDGDPLERFIAQALLFDVGGISQTGQTAGCDIEQLNAQQLVNDEGLLRQLFALLVNAHYKTTPADLYYLLESPDLTIFAARSNAEIVGVCLVAREGSFDAQMSEQIWQGDRRPRGHLLPQTLAVQCGFEQALSLSYARIVRIAVSESARRCGLGTQLLNAVAQHMEVDLLGSSFAATEDLLPFWQHAGFAPVRLGFRRDASSGCHSVLVLKPFSAAGNNLYAQVRQQFAQQLPFLLSREFAELDAALACALLTSLSISETMKLSSEEREQLVLFAAGKRNVESVMHSLHRLALSLLAQPQACSQDIQDSELYTPLQKAVLLSVCLQRHSLVATAQQLGLNGQKAVLEQLRSIVAKVLTD